MDRASSTTTNPVSLPALSSTHSASCAVRPLCVDRTQRTTFTAGLRGAVVLAHFHHQRVELVQERQAKFGQVVSKCSIHQLLHFSIFLFPGSEPVPVGNAAQILIHHCNGVKQRVEQNGVGSLFSHAR